MSNRSPITRILHSPRPTRAGPNSSIWRYTHRFKRLPGTGDMPFLLLREGIPSPPGWFPRGGVPQHLVEQHFESIELEPSDITKGVRRAWEFLPPLYLQIPSTSDDLPLRNRRLLQDKDLILPYHTHRAEVISTVGIDHLRITASQTMVFNHPSYHFSIKTFHAVNPSGGLDPGFVTMEENQELTNLQENTPRPPMTPSMTILLWNCNGARSRNFYRLFLDTVTLRRPDLVIISNTWVGGDPAKQMISDLGFDSSAIIDPPAPDSLGGIWFLWNHDQLNCILLGAYQYDMQVLVRPM